jgi:hypothetical protein
MTFERAIHASSARDCLRPGLSALENKDRAYLAATDTRKLNGSVYLENCLPPDATWDYLIGYDGKAYCVEVHPASTSEIGRMLNKLQWLKGWLNYNPEVKAKLAAGCFIWVASGPVDLLPTVQKSKQLALSGIVGPTKHYTFK